MKMKSLLLSAMILPLLFLQQIQAQTYHNLLGGPFTQNWSNTGLITVSDDWSGVPSIIGYRGDSSYTATGVDPQTMLRAFFSTVVDVNANQTNPDTYTTGGVTEFEITDPVVALQGSGTADAPNLVVYINTTGCSSIHVQFNVRDIDGSGDNAVQQFALQYRVGTTGDFINIPEAYIADATTGPNLATLVTPLNITLPAACNNQAQVQIRFMTTNAPSSDEWIGIDDIVISQISTPTVTVTSPATGAQWKQGSTHAITWSASNTNSNVKIEFTDNASAGTPTWTVLNASVAASAGTWNWAIPSNQATSSDCKIRITDIPQTATGLSGTFSIIPPPPSVTSIAALRAGTLGNEYTLSSEAILTFQQTFRHQKYIQDATGGILIDDNAGVITTTYNLGDGITGITGQLNEFGNMMQFTPIQNTAAASSTGNVIAPQEITLNELVNNFDNYESELVKVNFCQFTTAGGTFANGTVYPMTDLYGGAADFRTTFYDVNYIGTTIPTGYVDIVGLPNARSDGNFLTARDLADITVSQGTSNDIIISEIYYNPPDGGNDTIEFIELYNKGGSAVDVKDWYFSDGVQYIFPDTAIAAGSYYVVARNAQSFANTFNMNVAEWSADFLDDAGELIRLKDNLGFTKDSVHYLPAAPWPVSAAGNGPSIEFCDPALDNSLGENWHAAVKYAGMNAIGDSLFATPGETCSTGANLVFTEIMYNPPESGTDSLEFVEIYNRGNAINLEGFKINDAFVYTFPSYDLAANSRVMLAVNATAFLNTFGKTALQWTSGSLSNGGETITLRDIYGNIVDQVTYDDAAPWPTPANGHGPSLTLCDPSSNNALPINWTASTEYIGVNSANDSIYATPGEGCFNPPPVANFEGTPTSIIAGGSVQFTDLSTNNPSAWVWSFAGGNPASSTEQNPVVLYNTPGLFSVTLTATNAYGSNTITKTDYITVGVDGVITTSNDTYLVYPNPAKDFLNIVNSKTSDLEICLFNTQGKLFSCIQSHEAVIEMSLSNAVNGIYLLKISDRQTGQITNQKIIVK